MNKVIENMVEDILTFLEQCLALNQIDNIKIIDGLELKGLKNTEIDTVKRKVKDWSMGNQYLEFKVTILQGLYIRLNKSHFNFEGKTINISSPKAFSFYHRKRKPYEKNSKMTLICHLLKKGLGDKIMQHVNAITFDKTLETLIDDGTYRATQANIPTLEVFLPTYESLMYLENPDTAKTRVSLIRKTFASMFKAPVNHIRGKELIEFMNTFKRKLTAVEIQEGASRFTVEESTMKGYICGIRGLITRASKYSDHPFDLCGSLYCDALKFKINNDSDKFLTIEGME